VNSQGCVAKQYGFGGAKAQRFKLQSEKVKFAGKKGERVDLSFSLWRPHQLLYLFFKLLRQYGEPGPWPWFGQDAPHTSEEIAIGAILTQNTSWRNVELALENLRRAKLNNLRGIYQMGVENGEKGQRELKELIRSAGFFNQKAEYLIAFTTFIIKNFGGLCYFFKQSLNSARQQLLKVRGIGPETADTILLYAGNQLIFVIDGYTKRFIQHHNLGQLGQNLRYDILQEFFIINLPHNVKLYQDYHALIVKWGKEWASK
jgi:endonuclease-3 related protein